MESLEIAIRQLGPVDIVSMVLGAFLLVFGRRLFWLALAGLGFAVAHHFAQANLLFGDAQTRLVVSLLIGLAGGLFAVMAQKLAIGVAGLVLGGWGALVLIQEFAPDLGLVGLLLVALGGALGLVFASRLFRAALIVVTSAVGAVLILRPLELDPQVEIAAWIVLALVGVVTQVGKKRRKAKLEE